MVLGETFMGGCARLKAKLGRSYARLQAELWTVLGSGRSGMVWGRGSKGTGRAKVELTSLSTKLLHNNI